MSNQDFDPDAYLANKAAAPAASPAASGDFDPDEYLKSTPAPTVGDAADRLKMMANPLPTIASDLVSSEGRKRLWDDATSYPENLYEAGKDALTTINDNLNPWSEKGRAPIEDSAEHPVTGALSNLASTAKGVMGVGELAASPITAAVKSAAPVIAAPMAAAEEAVGTPIAKAINPNNTKLPSHEEVYNTTEPSVETALGLAIPGKGRLAPIPGTPTPPPPAPEAPFGVNLNAGQESGDLAAQSKIKAALDNRSGKPAYEVASARQNEQNQQIEASKDVATSKLSPTGDIAARTPEEAGNIISDALQELEAQRQQGVDQTAEQLRPKGLIHPQDAAQTVSDSLSQAANNQATAQRSTATALDADTEAIRNSLSPTGQVIAANPQEAADIVSAGVTRAEEQATQARDAAYERFESLPGSFRPGAFTDIANRVRRAVLYDPKDPFIANDKTTPNTLNAINDLDENLGAPAREAADPDTASFEPFTPSRINDIRKRLVAYSRAANNTARATNDYSDVAGMSRVTDAFDDTVTDALKRKRLFDGDGKAISQAWDDARASHASLRRTFSPQGKGDVVGPVMNKIVGQREGQAAPANQIEQWTTGNGGTPVLVGRRLQSIFGPNSLEIGAIKQSLWSKAVDPKADGMPPLSATEKADNIDELRASALAREHFTPEELSRMRQHAIDLRNSVPEGRASTDVVGKKVEQMVGEGGQPWTPEQTRAKLFGRSGVGEDADGVKIAQHIKDTQGTDSDAFRALQEGQLSSLTRASEGAAGFNPRKIASDIREHLNGTGKPMADTLWDGGFKKKLSDYAGALDQHADSIAAPKDPVEAAIAKIASGKMSDQEVFRTIMGRAGANDKATALGIVRRLKQVLPPEKFAALKQVVFRQTIEPGPGENGATFSSANIVKKMASTFNNAPELMREIYTPDDINMIRQYQALHRKLVPQQAAMQQWNKPYADSIKSRITGAVLSGIGALVGRALSPIPFLGEVAGYGAGKALNSINNMRAETKSAKEVATLMPSLTEKMDQWQKSFAAAQRTGLPPYQARSASAAVALSNALKPIGIDFRGIVGAVAQNKNNGQGWPQNQQGNGSVPPQTRRHGGRLDDSGSQKPKFHPKVTGARLAPDGEYYLSDPNRPGKYLKVVDARSVAA